MWAPVAYAYFFTAVILRLLTKEARRYARLRTRFLAEGDDDDGPQARCSVVVERVPKALRSDDALTAYFRRLMGADAVHSAVVFVDRRARKPTFAFEMRRCVPRNLRLRDAAVCFRPSRLRGVAAPPRGATWIFREGDGRRSTAFDKREEERTGWCRPQHGVFPAWRGGDGVAATPRRRRG